MPGLELPFPAPYLLASPKSTRTPCVRCRAPKSVSLLANGQIHYWHCPRCGFVWTARDPERPSTA